MPVKAKRHAAQELALLLDDLGRGALFPERPADTIDLQGWLELAWEDAPHLIVAGANEGVLPETIHGDRFLPESIRRHLACGATRSSPATPGCWLIGQGR